MSWGAFDDRIEVVRGTSMDLLCDRCGGPAIVLADFPAGPFLVCDTHFAQHAMALVERHVPLTLIVGIH